MPLVLSYLNVSNKSNLLADSGFVFQSLLLEGLRKLGWSTVLVGPPGVGDVIHGEVIEVPMPDHKYGVRFGFPWSDLEQQIRGQNVVPDVLLVNQPELTLPMAVMINSICARRVPVVTYFHYIPIEDVSTSGQLLIDSSLDDYGVGEFLWARQVESAQYSDLALIGSEWGRQLFLAASRQAPQLASKLRVLPPPVDQPYFTAAREGTAGVFNFLYNHRLYAHYGTREMFTWLHDLHKEGNVDFRVTVTNPTSRRSEMRKVLDSSVEAILNDLSGLPFVDIVHATTRDEYQATVSAADAGIAPLRRGALWSMAVADLMAGGRPVIGCPNGALAEVIGDEELLFTDRKSFLTLTRRLLDDGPFRMEKGIAARERAGLWQRDLISTRFAKLIDDILAST